MCTDEAALLGTDKALGDTERLHRWALVGIAMHWQVPLVVTGRQHRYLGVKLEEVEMSFALMREIVE